MKLTAWRAFYELSNETLDKIALKPYHLEPHHVRWIKILAIVIVAVVLLNMAFGKHLRNALTRKKPVTKTPLKFDKIVVDEGNARKEIRVKVRHEMMFENARFPDDKRRKLPETATSVDVSHKGLAFLSEMQFPKKTDITFRLMETKIVASPVMTGTVVACRPRQKEEGETRQLYLTSLQLKNLNERASALMHRIVNDAERATLAREREDRETEEYGEKPRDNRQGDPKTSKNGDS